MTFLLIFNNENILTEIKEFSSFDDASEMQDKIEGEGKETMLITAADRHALESSSPYYKIGAKYPEDGDDGF